MASMQPTCGCLFFYLPHGLVWVSEIELSHMGKNNCYPDLVCEKQDLQNSKRVWRFLEIFK